MGAGQDSHVQSGTAESLTTAKLESILGGARAETSMACGVCRCGVGAECLVVSG